MNELSPPEHDALHNRPALTKLAICWMLLQLPRLYNVYKEMGVIESFQTVLDNVFIPLFEVTVDPSSHPQLHVFLKQVSDELQLFPHGSLVDFSIPLSILCHYIVWNFGVETSHIHRNVL